MMTGVLYLFGSLVIEGWGICRQLRLFRSWHTVAVAHTTGWSDDRHRIHFNLWPPWCILHDLHILLGSGPYVTECHWHSVINHLCWPFSGEYSTCHSKPCRITGSLPLCTHTPLALNKWRWGDFIHRTGLLTVLMKAQHLYGSSQAIYRPLCCMELMAQEYWYTNNCEIFTLNGTHWLNIIDWNSGSTSTLINSV